MSDQLKNFQKPLWFTYWHLEVPSTYVCINICIYSGLKKVTDDMKSKNRTDRAGVVSSSVKESQVSSSNISRTVPPKLELQMGRKWEILYYFVIDVSTNFN